MKDKQQENCDNCVSMTLTTCRDRLTHRRCEYLQRIIPDWEHNATCDHHKSIALKGGKR